MTKQEFLFPDGRIITSVVMDEGEFSGLCDAVAEMVKSAPPVNLKGGARFSRADVDKIRAAKNLPCISRGTLTQTIFEKYEIDTVLASFIVRGEGERVFGRTFGN